MMESISSQERFVTVGKFLVRLEWRGDFLVYDVTTKGGLLYACGFDRNSGDERTALEGITNRLYGKGFS